MRIFSINSVPYGSTYNIMYGIAEMSKEKGNSAVTSSGYSTHPNKNLPQNHYDIGGMVDKSLHIVLSRLTGYNGCFSHVPTRQLLRQIKKQNVDLIHLHNLHGWYVNIPMLFKYIKKRNIPVIWTLHDCWAMTGQCPHFTMVKCDKWKTGCGECPQYREYPASYVDRTKTMWKLKKKWFSGVQNMIIVTPSEWLAGLVRESFLSEYPVKVINNGIDLDVFKPTESDFREKHGLQNKKIVLGVAFGWGVRKGLDVFEELARRLPEDEYSIVLVGTTDDIDARLPKNIISIHRTQNQRELAEIYTAADVFVNPTREDNYPTVNMEAIACGTPVITFKTGGSPEMLDENCGSVVECDDVDAMEHSIRQSGCSSMYSKESCFKKARVFDKNAKFFEYIKLYEAHESLGKSIEENG